MQDYNFDKGADRKGTGAMKYDCLAELFGRDDLTPFWIADMDFECCHEIIDALRRRLDHPVLGYSTVPESYKKSIVGWLAHRHNLKADESWLAFVPGIVRGIGFAVNYFTSPGDKIVIQPPVYHPFRLVTEGNGRVVVNNPLILDENGNYSMDLEGLETIFKNQRPKMLILCNPHNPGGIQWDEATLRKVAELAKKYGVVVLSDEIHGDLMMFGTRHIPFASVSPEAAEVSVSFGAPSKTFNIAGLASSWMLVPNPELRRGFYHWMEVNEFSTPSFPAVIATEAAYTYAEPWLDSMISYVEDNIREVENWMDANLPVIKPLRPQSSFLIWLDCRGLGLTQSDLVSLFVDGAHLALNDGTMFGAEGTGFMRLNVGHPRAQVIKALESLKAAIEERNLPIAQ
ncbi:MAG: pyridoxal phosphate-dependent aminotransferase [Bacteroides sp.]|nr:pyridoxal phosphate-dependent aminotransferase [Bacteroides sp.]